ncbi:hypothetical protein [Clostridium cochlearium]|uniref:hypothetical protein n=1 Tax=Clostridium cochlearium TaxID=1494 RepID=UPI000BBBF48C|nr:hypothetical protein [Clostridium cochlearium]MBE6063985.1 hypothetical protein [Clostridium cochlearium]MBE6082834.1 hypothetical protein [Tissierellaceae bacterium]
MYKVYNFVTDKIAKDDIKNIEKYLSEKFCNKDLYSESNLGFYFNEETGEITAENDGFREVIHVVEKEEKVDEIKEYFLGETVRPVYNVYYDPQGNEVLEIGLYDLDKETNILGYIFEEFLRSDIESFLREE